MSVYVDLDGLTMAALELRPDSNESDLETFIRAVYKQVLGNQHLMACDRNETAESLLRNRDITVREFVRKIGQSELYQSLFFYKTSQNRFIELNFKHFLGRPPQDQDEIREHVEIYNDLGYEAEIDSYINSDEYYQYFGENRVPYPRSISTQVGLKNESFNRMFSLLRGPATNDTDNRARLITSIAANMATPIKLPTVGNGANYGNTKKRFEIVFTTNKKIAQLNKVSKQKLVINYTQMSQTVQKVQRQGGKILSIIEKT